MSISTREASRRTLIKGAAWTAPVIVVAAAAPAMAATGPADLRVSIASALRTNGNGRNVAFVSTIANVNTLPSTGQLHTLTVTLEAAGDWGNASISAPGFIFVPVTVVGASRSWQCTSAVVVPGLGGVSFNPVVVVGGSSNVAPGTVSIVANPSVSQTLNSASIAVTGP